MADRLARWWRHRVIDPLQLGFFGTPAANEVAPSAPPTSRAAPAAPAAPSLTPPVRTPAPTAPRAAAPSRTPAGTAAASAALLARLEALGLRGISQLTLRRTRRVMVSARGDRLTVHRDFATAPDAVLTAIVRFVMSRRRSDRLAAQQVILSYDVSRPPPRRRLEPTRPGDVAVLARLRAAHAEFNDTHFAGALRPIHLSVSGRMKTRLGQYTPVQEGVPEAEISIGRRHIRRDAWADVLHTLLHEMVHQWQDESGLPIDHGLAFRRKAREVGCLPRAKRALPR